MLKLIPTTQCMCSGCTFNSIIFIPCSEAARRIHAVIKFLCSSLRNIAKRYFVHHSKCHIDIPTVCLLRSYLSAKLSLSCICCSIFPPREARCRAPQSFYSERKLQLHLWFRELQQALPVSYS